MNFKDFKDDCAFENCRNFGSVENAYKRYLSKNYNEEDYNRLLKTINDTTLINDAKELIKAIELNYLSCKEDNIDDTGSYIKQMHIAEELENLKNSINDNEGVRK